MFRYSLFAILFTALLTLINVPSSRAQEAGVDPNKIEEIRLRITQAPEPRPALQYTLWTPDRELQPGNGAQYYYRAMLLRQQAQKRAEKEFNAEQVGRWLNVPLAEFPKSEVRKYLELHRLAFNELSIATTREHCEWDLRVKELKGTDVVNFLLHDFQEIRDLARLTALEARCHLVEGKFDDALRSLRMGYRIAHDAAEVPLLINGLIGLASTAMMNSVVIDWINTPNSPNLYWALKQLPHPLVDIRPALQFEMNMPFQMFPFLADAETKVRSPQEWQALMQQTAKELNSVRGLTSNTGAAPQWQVQLTMASLAIKTYPIAKQELIASGLAADEVNKMPVAQVLAIQASRSYRYTYHEIFKWALLPYPEARTRLAETQERLKREGYLGSPLEGKEVLPIASLLLPALDSVVIATVRTDRRLAALETLEAVRMQAAIGPHQLPPTLSALSVVPAPPNPFTGQPFGYRVESGNTAVLEESSVGIDPVRANDRRYLIELEKSIK